MRSMVFLFSCAWVLAGCWDSDRTKQNCLVACPDAGAGACADAQPGDPDTGGGGGGEEDAGSEPPAECDFGDGDCGGGEEDIYGVCVADGMVALDGGIFIMGSGHARYADARPERDVTVGGFELDRHEVTVGAWRACVSCGVCAPPEQDGSFAGREPYYGDNDFDDYPAIYVSWQQAAAFCEGLGKRLPTEAEWEYAARGTNNRSWPWGNSRPNPDVANYGYTYGDTMPVDAFPGGASPDGVAALAGNVWEWVADTYAVGYDASETRNPTGPAEGPLKVARGGSFGSVDSWLRPWARQSFHATGAYTNVGFRCAR